MPHYDNGMLSDEAAEKAVTAIELLDVCKEEQSNEILLSAAAASWPSATQHLQCSVEVRLAV